MSFFLLASLFSYQLNSNPIHKTNQCAFCSYKFSVFSQISIHACYQALYIASKNSAVYIEKRISLSFFTGNIAVLIAWEYVFLCRLSSFTQFNNFQDIESRLKREASVNRNNIYTKLLFKITETCKTRALKKSSGSDIGCRIEIIN